MRLMGTSDCCISLVKAGAMVSGSLGKGCNIIVNAVQYNYLDNRLFINYSDMQQHPDPPLLFEMLWIPLGYCLLTIENDINS